MNREIKFRAWDKHKKLFIPTNLWALVQTDFGAFGAMLKDWENYKEGEYFYSNSQELSQFTGLHDKNSKEIYEGDILMIPDYRKGIYITGKQPLKKQVMVYSNGFHGADFGGEIIGNIYENPELL